MFLELLESELVEISESEEIEVLEFIINAYGDGLEESIDYKALKEEMDLDEEEVEELKEAFVRRVSSTGAIKKIKNKTIRKIRATATTGMSLSQRKMRARKSALSRKRNPSGVRKAIRKRSKAMMRRKRMGIKSGT
jgi:hypothetical protein